MNTAFKLFLIIAILGFSASQPDVENKNGVLVLTQDSFRGTLDHYEYVLVMFFAPWCGHCKKLHPEFEAAA
jgi:thiol-disulfide isomerase/thioredoxin